MSERSFAPSRGDVASRLAADWSARTRSSRAGEPPELWGHFAQSVSIGAERIVISADGIGTKIEVAERVGRFDTLGYDLIAMVADDVAAIGAVPCAISNVLDVSAVDESVIDELFRGLHDAAKRAGVEVTGGEIAELGARIGGYGAGMHLTWSATCVGHLPQGWEPIDGRAIEPGHAILAVREHGFRSNGFTTLRRGLEAKLGARWHEAPCEGGTWGEVALTPSLVCAPLVVALRRAELAPSGIAHVTGGGIPSKLGRILRVGGHGATLSHPLPPPAPMQELVELVGISSREAYETFHMGPALLLVMPADNVERSIAPAAEAGYRLERVGQVDREPGIRIVTPQHGTLAFAPSSVWTRA